jgi:hypothetical protein
VAGLTQGETLARTDLVVTTVAPDGSVHPTRLARDDRDAVSL